MGGAFRCQSMIEHSITSRILRIMCVYLNIMNIIHTLQLKPVSLWYSLKTEKNEMFRNIILFIPDDIPNDRDQFKICIFYDYSSFHPTSFPWFSIYWFYSESLRQSTRWNEQIDEHLRHVYCVHTVHNHFYFFQKIIPFVLDKPGCTRKKKMQSQVQVQCVHA